MKEVIFKTETKLLHCPECGEDIRITTQISGDAKQHHHEFQRLMMGKFERRENLYLRDTSKHLKEDTHHHYNEVIRVLYFNKLYDNYIVVNTYSLQPIPMENSFIISLILGKEKENGLEIIDIYGNTN